MSHTKNIKSQLLSLICTIDRNDRASDDELEETWEEVEDEWEIVQESMNKFIKAAKK